MSIKAENLQKENQWRLAIFYKGTMTKRNLLRNKQTQTIVDHETELLETDPLGDDSVGSITHFCLSKSATHSNIKTLQ